MKNTYLKPLFAAFAAALACLSADAETVALWGDGQMQGRSAQADTLNKRNMFNGIKTPALELFLAKSDKPNTAAQTADPAALLALASLASAGVIAFRKKR